MLEPLDLSPLAVGIVIGIAFRAGNLDLRWTRALLLWFCVALLLGVSGVVAIYAFSFDAYNTGRVVGGAWAISLIPLILRSQELSSFGLGGLGDVTAAEKPRILLAGCLGAVWWLIVLNAVNISLKML